MASRVKFRTATFDQTSGAMNDCIQDSFADVSSDDDPTLCALPYVRSDDTQRLIRRREFESVCSAFRYQRLIERLIDVQCFSVE